MRKTVFLFPGQGSQYVGMGQAFYHAFPVARDVFAEADEVLGFKLSEIIFQGKEEELRQTEITQPAILTTSMAILAVLREAGIKADATAGFSLGEYSALVCAGVLNFRDALLVVRERGKYMQNTVPAGSGGMAAILGLSAAEVSALCEMCLPLGHVEPANFNCPGQIVISGYRNVLEEVCRLARERKARTVMLSVSAPFHSRLLFPLHEKMSLLLKDVPLNRPEILFVNNVHAACLQDPEAIRESLVEQVYRPVLWEDAMLLLLYEGYDFFIEVGPGRVLTGFMKKISSDVQAVHVEDPLTMERMQKMLEEV
ncbi:MAG: ACP S-malonyltransferase [Bacillota bacterium]